MDYMTLVQAVGEDPAPAECDSGEDFDEVSYWEDYAADDWDGDDE